MQLPKLYSSAEALKQLEKHNDRLTRGQLHHLTYGTQGKESVPILKNGVHYTKLGTYTFYTDEGIKRILHRKLHRKPYTKRSTKPSSKS